MYTHGVDVSAYNTNIPYEELLKNGIKFIIIKGNNGTATNDHYLKAKAAGFEVVGLYFWNDPTISAAVQLNIFKPEIDKYKPNLVVLDVEQWWASWQSYWDAIAGKIQWAEVPKKSSKAISDNAYTVSDGLKKYLNDSAPFLVYTANWFTNSYSPDMMTWLPDYDCHVASYFDYGKTTYRVNYDYILSTPPETYKPVLPSGTYMTTTGPKYVTLTNYKIHQYTSRFIYPNMNAPLDTNVFKGSYDELKRYCKLGPAILTLDERVTRLEEWARTHGYQW